MAEISYRRHRFPPVVIQLTILQAPQECGSQVMSGLILRDLN